LRGWCRSGLGGGNRSGQLRVDVLLLSETSGQQVGLITERKAVEDEIP